MNKATRKTGYYWVKPFDTNEWEPAHYSNDTNTWILLGMIGTIPEEKFKEIDERIIVKKLINE